MYCSVQIRLQWVVDYLALSEPLLVHIKRLQRSRQVPMDDMIFEDLGLRAQVSDDLLMLRIEIVDAFVE